MSAHLLYILEIESTGVAATVKLNDIDVFIDRERPRRFLQSKVNGSLVAGTNVIDVRLDALPDGLSGGPFRFALMSGVHGDIDSLKKIVSWEWTWDPARKPPPEEPPQLPTEFHQEFPLGVFLPRWGWQDAPPITLDAAQAASLRAAVQAFHGAVAARDVPTIIKLLKRKNEELGRAINFPFTQIEGNLAEDLGEIFGDPTFVLEPLHADLRMAPMAGGRLVQVRGRDFGPPIRGRSSEGPLTFELIYMRSSSGWDIVR